MIGRLIGWQFGWLAGWVVWVWRFGWVGLVCWLGGAGWLVVTLMGWLVDWFGFVAILVGWSIGWLGCLVLSSMQTGIRKSDLDGPLTQYFETIRFEW